MKKIYIITFILITMTFLFAENPVALLFQAKGDVTLQREQQEETTVKKGGLLVNNDKLSTGGKSYAAVKYTDNGSLVKVFPWSIVTINGTRNGELLSKKVKLEAGQVFSKINSHMKDQYRLETSNTVASVKGTSFLTIIDPEGTTWIHMFKGLLEIQNTITGKKFNLEPGNTAESRSDGEVNIGPTPKLNAEIMDYIKGDIEGTQKIKVPLRDAEGNIRYIELEIEE